MAHPTPARWLTGTGTAAHHLTEQRLSPGAISIKALTAAQAASPLAGRPYDLRHAGVSLWLRSGVDVTEVARRAGHSVDVLLRIYASVLDDTEKEANKRIEEALTEDDDKASGERDDSDSD